MASVDVPVALLGYGTVGAAVNRLLTDSADDIERATGHRLRVVKALVRDVGKERDYPPLPGGVLTTDFQEIAGDPSIAVVAEVMGGVDPAGGYVLELLRGGKHVVSANKQLIARRGAELFAAASAGGVQLRFEASVCAAIPVIKVLREALVVTNVHRVLGIVNGTTNFVLTEMEAGKTYDEALADAQQRGYAEADPTDDVSGADAAAKMAILATVAFNSRVDLDGRRLRRHHRGRLRRRRRRARARHGDPARRRGAARRTGASTFASSPRSSTGSTRSRRSTARSTPSCCRETRSARSRSRGRAPAASRPPRR